MDLDEFLERLEIESEARSRIFTWTLDNGYLRAHSHDGAICCPLSFCDPLGPSGVGAWVYAYQRLGMEYSTARVIMHAADNPAAYTPIRYRLLTAVGLR